MKVLLVNGSPSYRRDSYKKREVDPSDRKKRPGKRMAHALLLLLAACLLFTAAGCSGGSRPFEGLKPEDVESLRIEYLPGELGYTFVDLNEERIARMVDLLSEITLFDPHDEVYYGPWWSLVITKKDGTRTTVGGAGAQSITIDGTNYYWKSEGVIDKLDAFCQELKPSE